MTFVGGQSSAAACRRQRARFPRVHPLNGGRFVEKRIPSMGFMYFETEALSLSNPRRVSA